MTRSFDNPHFEANSLPDTLAASNAPAPPRSVGWLGRRLQAWLGIADQRHDFDALAMTLEVKDRLVAGQRRDLDETARVLSSLAQQLNHFANLVASAQDRLHWYETRVPQIAGAKKAYDATIAREKARRERLVADHPEWSPETKQHVLQHGTLPGERAGANRDSAHVTNPIEVVQRMPESEADLADPSRLRIIRPGDVDDSA